MSLFAGQIPGLGVMSNNGDPSSNAEASISIRGNNGSPLLVIDGVPRLGTNTGDGGNASLRLESG